MTIALETRLFGANECKFIPPDQVHFTFRGRVQEADAVVHNELLYTYADAAKRDVYVMYNLAQFEGDTYAARKRVNEIDRPHPYAGVAIIGANFAMRTLVGMIIRSGRLLSPERFKLPIRFVATMDEAQAWFDELRKGVTP